VHTRVAAVIGRVREPSGTAMGDQDHWYSGGIPLVDGSARITGRGEAGVGARLHGPHDLGYGSASSGRSPTRPSEIALTDRLGGLIPKYQQIT
jgi:hypothetical protein